MSKGADAVPLRLNFLGESSTSEGNGSGLPSRCFLYSFTLNGQRKCTINVVRDSPGGPLQKASSSLKLCPKRELP